MFALNTDDLNKELSFELTKDQIDEWTNNISLSNNDIEVGEFDDHLFLLYRNSLMSIMSSFFVPYFPKEQNGIGKRKVIFLNMIFLICYKMFTKKSE